MYYSCNINNIKLHLNQKKGKKNKQKMFAILCNCIDNWSRVNISMWFELMASDVVEFLGAFRVGRYLRRMQRNWNLSGIFDRKIDPSNQCRILECSHEPHPNGIWVIASVHISTWINTVQVFRANGLTVGLWVCAAVQIECVMIPFAAKWES